MIYSTIYATSQQYLYGHEFPAAHHLLPAIYQLPINATHPPYMLALRQPSVQAAVVFTSFHTPLYQLLAHHVLPTAATFSLVTIPNATASYSIKTHSIAHKPIPDVICIHSNAPAYAAVPKPHVQHLEDDVEAEIKEVMCYELMIVVVQKRTFAQKRQSWCN